MPDAPFGRVAASALCATSRTDGGIIAKYRLDTLLGSRIIAF